jgi:hypothetical protein
VFHYFRLVFEGIVPTMSHRSKVSTPEGSGSLPTQPDEKIAVVCEHSIENSNDENIDSPEAVRKLLWKLDTRVLPIFLLLWFLTFIDRVNIANAKVQGLEKGLGMKGNQYNVALTVSNPESPE